MAVSQKLQETGWFYHAPPKRSANSEPKGVPPASQIPGLSDLPPQDPEDHHVLINDFDSPYVRMAKMGGRPDLLRMHTPKPPAESAKPYPKVDWYYQEDIKMEEDERRVKERDETTTPEKPHEFLLPDYMVHNENKPVADQAAPPSQQRRGKHTQTQKWKPAPFAMDYTLPFQTEGHSSHKPEGRVHEERKLGYGVRVSKTNSHAPASYNMPQRDRPIKYAGELGEDRSTLRPMTPPKEASNVSMAKLMEHGYGRDWQTDRNRWYEKQQKASDQFDDIKQQRHDESAQQQQLEQQQQRAAANTNQNAKSKTAPRVDAQSDIRNLLENSYVQQEGRVEEERWSHKKQRASDRFDSLTEQRLEAQRREEQQHKQQQQQQQQQQQYQADQQQQQQQQQQHQQHQYRPDQQQQQRGQWQRRDSGDILRHHEPEYDDFTDRRSQTNECGQSERSQGSQSKQSRRSEGGDSRQSQRTGRSELMQSHRSERSESRQTEATENSSLGRQNISSSKMAATSSREIALLPRDLDAPMSRVAISPEKATGQYNRRRSNFAQPKLMSSH